MGFARKHVDSQRSRFFRRMRADGVTWCATRDASCSSAGGADCSVKACPSGCSNNGIVRSSESLSVWSFMVGFNAVRLGDRHVQVRQRLHGSVVLADAAAAHHHRRDRTSFACVFAAHSLTQKQKTQIAIRAAAQRSHLRHGHQRRSVCGSARARLSHRYMRGLRLCFGRSELIVAPLAQVASVRCSAAVSLAQS